MPPATPSTELFGISEPTVKHGQVAFSIRTADGLTHVHAEKSIVLGFARLVILAAGVPVPKSKPVVEKPRKKGTGLPLPAEVEEKYRLIRQELIAGRSSQRELCRRYGIVQGSYSAWLVRQRKLEAAASAPVLKPGGQIL